MGNSTTGIAPDFRPRAPVVRLGVVRIGELVQHAAHALGLHPHGQVAGALHSLFLTDLDQLGAVGGHRLLALIAHVRGHDEFQPVALDGRRHGQGDAGVAAGGLDQHIAGPELTAFLGALDHAERRTVLHRAGGIISLQLEQDGAVGVRSHALQAHKGRVADTIFDGGVIGHESGDYTLQ